VARTLPSRPSLRYLKLEAKRRLAVGEFRRLHDAQRAIAREHGLPNWTALKQLIGSQPRQESHALLQLSWLIGRFRDADQPGWSAPGAQELREHFSDQFLAANPPERLVATIAATAPRLREEFVVTAQAPLAARVQFAGVEVFTSVEPAPPHRLTRVRRFHRGSGITDARIASAEPTASADGEVPAGMAEIAAAAFTELGLAGLVIAGGGPGTPAWTCTQGWADLEQAEILQASHRFPAPGIAGLVTATAVLRLLADGRFTLDTPANDQLRTVRLADDTITVRELLSHTAGVDIAAPLFADSVPDLLTLAGPVIACDGPRGVVRPSNGGYAVLGQLIADVTGAPYPDAAARIVLEPLGMTSSRFPARTADIGPHAVTTYHVTPEGIFEPLPLTVCTMPAAGELWTTAADVVRLGTGWSALLPPTLVAEALTPQPARAGGGRNAGLGWLIGPHGDVAVHSGIGPGATASLLLRIRDGQVHMTMTNRMTPVEQIDAQVVRSWTRSGTDQRVEEAG
jgi:CubicO group peptidase (beta-lactamase class C family)